MIRIKSGQRYYHIVKERNGIDRVEELYLVKMKHFKSGYGYYTDASPVVRGLDARENLYESREAALNEIHSLFKYTS